MMVVVMMMPGVGAGGAGRGQKRNRQNGGDDSAHLKILSNRAQLRWDQIYTLQAGSGIGGGFHRR